MLSPKLHSVIHLTRCVGFENMNGHIKLHRHGCKNFLPSVVPSLVNAVTTKYSVSNCVKRLSKTESLKVLQFLVGKGIS